MGLVVDKGAVRASFSAAASAYDLWSAPQREIARALAALLPRGEGVGEILDLGCGTGTLTALLRERYPGARILAVDLSEGMIAACRERWPNGSVAQFELADAEAFELERRFDLLAASSTFQWLGDRRGVMRRMRGHLARGGQFALAAPVMGTLGELAAAHAEVTGREMPQLDLWDEGEDASALTGEGFKVELARVESFQVWYDGPLEVLRSLRGVGATLRGHPGYRALAVGEVRDVVEVYGRAHADAEGRAPATYRVFYAIAEAAG